jgi:hypothetical protein
MLAPATSTRLAWSGLQEGGLRQIGSAPSFRYKRSMAYEGSERWGTESWCVIKVRITIGCDSEVCRRGALISYAGGQDVSGQRSSDFAEIGGPGVRNCWARMDTYQWNRHRLPKAGSHSVRSLRHLARNLSALGSMETQTITGCHRTGTAHLPKGAKPPGAGRCRRLDSG